MRIAVLFIALVSATFARAEPSEAERRGFAAIGAIVAPKVDREPYGWTAQRLLDFALPRFFALSGDGAKITREDFAIAERAAQAEQRARILYRAFGADLDGAGEVRLADLGRVDRLGAAGLARRTAGENLAEADVNGDGVVTAKEAFVWAQARIERAARPDVGKAVDVDGDGLVTRAEFEALVAAAHRAADADGDGRLARAETATLVAWSKFDLRGLARRCFYATPDPDAEFVAVHATGGRAYADVTLGGRNASVVELKIAPGEKPLALALAAPYSMVFRVTGETRRIASVALVPLARAGGIVSHPGVAGVVAARVTMMRQSDCAAPSLAFDARAGLGAARAFAMLFDRAPGATAAADIAAAVTLPAATISTEPAYAGVIAFPTEGAAAELWREARHIPLVGFTPDDVVAAAPVARARPSPGVAGLAELVEAGSLKVTRRMTPRRPSSPASRRRGRARRRPNPSPPNS